MQFITSAIANTKAAVRFMTNVKIAKKVVTVSGKHYSELSYHEIFVQKTITPADISYFKDRQSTDGILNIIDMEIVKAPEYEWYPRTTLTAEQIRAMELRQVDCVNKATEVYEEQEKELAKAVRDIERKKLQLAKGIFIISFI
jgi:hypothetical protein